MIKSKSLAKVAALTRAMSKTADKATLRGERKERELKMRQLDDMLAMEVRPHNWLL